MESQEQVQQAQAFIRDGRKADARVLLTQVLKSDPRNVPAWLWLVETMDTDDQRIQVLEQCLRINPNNPMAAKALGIFKGKLTPAQPEVEPIKAEVVPEPPAFDEKEAELGPDAPMPFKDDEGDDLGEWRVLPVEEVTEQKAEEAVEPEFLRTIEREDLMDEQASAAELVEPTQQVFSDQVGVQPEVQVAPPKPSFEDAGGIARNPANPSKRPLMVEADPEPAPPKPKLPSWLIALIVIVDVALLIVLVSLMISFINPGQ